MGSTFCYVVQKRPLLADLVDGFCQPEISTLQATTWWKYIFNQWTYWSDEENTKTEERSVFHFQFYPSSFKLIQYNWLHQPIVSAIVSKLLQHIYVFSQLHKDRSLHVTTCPSPVALSIKNDTNELSIFNRIFFFCQVLHWFKSVIISSNNYLVWSV